MKMILQTRLLHIKKHWISLLFWLILPLIGSIGLTAIMNHVQDDSTIPIGIVVEEHNEVTDELINEISTTPFITALELSKKNALLQLKRHELDSVFIIHQDFANQVSKGNRRNIITSYQTNQSFAYTPVKEMIISYVQQETGRSNTAIIIRELAAKYVSTSTWTWNEIISKSKEVQKEESLLSTSFSFNSTERTIKEVQLWNIWGIWCVLAMLSTLLIFDWVVKERSSAVVQRFAFLRINFKDYLVRSLCVYSIIFIFMDCLTVYLFHSIYEKPVSFSLIMGLLCYRIVLLLGAFQLAHTVTGTFRYYVVSFSITLLTIVISGAVLPINGLLVKWPWLSTVNPLSPVLSGNFITFWLPFLVTTFIIWYVRKERYYA
ncbi:ABC transporter permease [Virgibacillus flavescens]|uniref:ABC transporter permease n=1 Tax=Virgibacillus flavescens TaxID=1611422 RepID=UPI003D34E38B